MLRLWCAWIRIPQRTTCMQADMYVEALGSLSRSPSGSFRKLEINIHMQVVHSDYPNRMQPQPRATQAMTPQVIYCISQGVQLTTMTSYQGNGMREAQRSAP